MVSHTVLAQISGVAELMLDDDEAKTLGNAIGEVLSHYNVSFLDDKTTAWINLGQVMFGIYGTRVMAARVRKAAERRDAQEAAQRAAERGDSIIRPAPTAPAQPGITQFTTTGDGRFQ